MSDESTSTTGPGPGPDEPMPPRPIDFSGLAFGDSDTGPEFAPGDRLGPYKIVNLLGEGGFGVVYLAEQVEPVTRLVALKLIKPGMDTRQVVARFQTERQALALMDHPGVARIYDAGATPTGRPFFAMEYVRGEPITAFCDAKRLSIRQRLRLLMEVCDAVQSAHQKGIIHRDLKPSNVLVVADQGRPRPKVIDFGIARAIHQAEQSHSLVTEQGQLIGTPEYMSPEQADQRSDLLDTRTDIYSLGVMLYELLTGSRPFDGQDLRKGGSEGAQRIIRQVQPPRPSLRIAQRQPSAASGGKSSGDAARVRRTDTRTLERTIRGDLDAITMHAMDKVRDRRYASVAQLREDLGRFLRNEPVLASPPSRRYLLGKFLARHRGGVVTAGLIALALVAATALTTTAYFGEQRARRGAQTDRLIADRAAREADDQRARAQAAADDAQAARAQAERDASRAQHAESMAVRDRDFAETRSYLKEIALAHFAWQAGDFQIAAAHLEGARREGRGWELDYLDGLFDQSLARVSLGTTAVTTSVIAPGRSLAIVGDRAGTLTLVDLAAMRAAGAVTLGLGPIASLAIAPDDEAVLAITQDGKGVVWDLADHQPLATMDLGDEVVVCAAIGPRGRELAVGLLDGSIVLREQRTGEVIARLPGRDSPVTGLAMSPDGTTLIASARDGQIDLWNLTRRRVVRALFPMGSVRALALSHDGSLLATADDNARVLVWDLALGTPIADHFGLVQGEVLDLAFAPDGGSLAIASADLSVTTWAFAATEAPTIGRASGHRRPVRSVAWVGEGGELVSFGLDGVARRWPRDLRPVRARWDRAHHSAITAISFDGVGQRVLTAAADGSVVVRDSDTLAPIEGEPWPGRSHEVAHATLTRLGTIGATLSTTGTLGVSTLATGKDLLTRAMGPSWTGALAIDPFESWVAVGSELGIARLIDLRGGDDRSLLGHEGAITCLVAGRSGRTLLSGGLDGVVIEWDPQSGAQRATISAMDAPITALAVAASTQRRAAGGRDGSVLVWTDEGESITLRGHAGPVTALCFDSSGERLFSASADGSVVLWHAATGDEILTLLGAEASVGALAVSPDGRRLLAGFADGMVATWDASTRDTPPPTTSDLLVSGDQGPNVWIQDAYAADERGGRITPRAGVPFTIAVVHATHAVPVQTPLSIRRTVDDQPFDQRAQITAVGPGGVSVDLSLAGRWVIQEPGLVGVTVLLNPQIAGGTGETSLEDNTIRFEIRVLPAQADTRGSARPGGDAPERGGR